MTSFHFSSFPSLSLFSKHSVRVQERDRKVKKTSKSENETMELKDTFTLNNAKEIKQKWCKRKLFQKCHNSTLTYIFIQIFYQDILIFPIGLSKFLEHTEVNPTKYVEPTSFRHWQRVLAPHNHMQLLSTKGLLLLRLLLMLIFCAFSNCCWEILRVGHRVWHNNLRRMKPGPRRREGLSLLCTILFEIWPRLGWTSS